jgi:hypothetical protein
VQQLELLGNVRLAGGQPSTISETLISPDLSSWMIARRVGFTEGPEQAATRSSCLGRVSSRGQHE